MSDLTHHPHPRVHPDWPLGPYLTSARERAGLSVTEAAARADLAPEVVLRYETGYPDEHVEHTPFPAVGVLKSWLERLSDAIGADTAHALSLIGLTPEHLAEAARRMRSD